MRVPVFLLLTLSAGLIGGNQSALAASFRFVDEEGVVHFTNVPTDPRYKQHDESGMTSGSLKILGNGQDRYGLVIRQAAGRYGIESRLVEALIGVESAFDPWAVSRKGAQGLMQLMPQTAAALGVRNSFNPCQNIEGGVRHLRYLLDRYGGDLALALAAYNAGPRVVEWYRGIPPYPETWLYIRRVLGLYRSGSGEVTRQVEVLSQPEVSSQIIYRYADKPGTVTYTNIPPSVPGSLSR